MLCSLSFLRCRYEKQEGFEKKRQDGDDDALEQKWKTSPQNERCRWCCGLVVLVIVLWGPLFAYSSSDILGSRKPARVEGVHVQLDVRALAGACDRPDPDGCTVDTYTLWSSSSAKLAGITSKASMYGPFQSLAEQASTKTNSIQKQLEETYT